MFVLIRLKLLITKALILFLFLDASTVLAQRAANQFRRVDISDGLSNNHINAVHSDRQGFLWFATRSGLNRFDGFNFRIFKNNPDDPKSVHENNIQRIFEDHLGYIWLFSGTGEFSVYDPRLESFSNQHPVFSFQNSPSRDSISAVVSDSDNNIWISNYHDGIFFFNTEKRNLTHLTSRLGDERALTSNQIMDIAISGGLVYAINQSGVIDVIDIRTLEVAERINYAKGSLYSPEGRNYRLFIDYENDLWIYSVNSGDGLYYLDIETRKTRNFSHQSYPIRLSHSNITGLVMDNQSRVWVGTELGGINIIDKSDFSTREISNISGDNTSLSSNSITSLFKSQDGIIWIGTFKNGINFYHENFFQFPLYRCQPHEEMLFFSNDVNCFAEDSKGNLWIGTNDDGLVYYDRHNGTFRSYRHDPDNVNSVSGNVIVSLFVDRNDKLWIGTYLHGLNSFDGKTFKRYKHDPLNRRSISDNRIWQIHRDDKGRLWIGTLGGGLNLYDDKTGGFSQVTFGDASLVPSNFILTIFEDTNGNIWFGTSEGLSKLDISTGRFTAFIHNPDDPKSISNNIVISVIEDSKGDMWIGTRNGLNRFDPQTKTFQTFRISDGLPDNNIISMELDSEENIWISTLNGISKMSYDEQARNFVFRNFVEEDGLQGREFNEHSSFRTSRGEIIFGGANGFNIFDPKSILSHDRKFPVKFTDFRLFNTSIKMGEKIDGRLLMPEAVNFLEEISLRHNQNVFTIEFATLNFFDPKHIRFRYMLEGFNDYWIETDALNNSATYTNLNPGKYTFRVAAKSNYGVWGEESSLSIVVIPPYYLTYWAFIVYGLGIIASIILLIRYIKRREKMKFARKQERMEYKRMCELDTMKTQFFTNVSHEFRTPLTMILTPVEKLLREIEDQGLHSQLTIIRRNGRRLLNLVNQLLDFRKLEVSGIQLNLSYGDIVLLLKESFDSFADLFESKNIACEFFADPDLYIAQFDSDKMEKIAFNLLSNAMKFTSEYGRVEMRVKRFIPESAEFIDVFEGREYIELKVIDTGIGIPVDRQQRIFDRFFQTNDNVNLINQGSGIGLSLVHEYVNMHGGKIDLHSEPGKGSCFTIKLPLDTNVNSIIPLVNTQIEPPPTYRHSTTIVPETKCQQKENNRPMILIVEDNEDLRFYLKENLKNKYKIIEASDGRTGWECVVQKMPHIVISDIMMPIEDGLDLCRKIKSDQRTSHIPVILLTARTTSEQRIEGLEAGAEDYITKPFNYELLQLKVQRLLDLRASFQKVFASKLEIAPGEISITSLDEKFLAKALKLAEENIGNPEFSVEKMSKDLGVSRGHLYNKLVALTGKTPVEFIRIMRLKRAAQLLGKSQLTVSEIAYKVGFNDPKYFTKYFKEEHGMIPSEYAKKNI